MHAYVLTSFCIGIFGLVVRTGVTLWKEKMEPHELLTFIWSAGFVIWAGILLWS